MENDICKYCGKTKPEGRKPVKYACVYCGAEVDKDFMEKQAIALYGSLSTFGTQKLIQSLARTFVNAQKTRIACASRLTKFRPYLEADEVAVLEEIHSIAEACENDIVAKMKEATKDHLLWQWSENVKGLGERGVITFLGYIDPYKAETGGKAKSYLGLVPNKGRMKGQEHNVNFQAKGRFFGVVLNGVILAKDPTYYNYYLDKKAEYSQRQDLAAERLEFLKNTTNKLSKGMKHIDNMAKRATLALMVSHGAEIMRRNEGLPVDAYKSHRRYIAPNI